MSLVDELAKLEQLHRSGALSDNEFSQAKAALLNQATAGAEQSHGEHLADHLAEVHYQNELAQIDREWQIERQQHLIRGRFGAVQEPSAGMGIGVAVGGGLFGTFWLIMAVAITAVMPDFGPFSAAKVIFPLVGVLFIGVAIGFGIYVYSRAQKYQQAFAAYKERRARAQLGQAGAADRPREHGEFSDKVKPA